MMWTKKSRELYDAMKEKGKAACDSMLENMELGMLMYTSMRDGICEGKKDKTKTDCSALLETMGVEKPEEALKKSPTYLSKKGSANFRDCWAKSAPFKTPACTEMVQVAYDFHLQPVYEGYCDAIVNADFKKECKGVYDDRTGWKAKVMEHLNSMSSASIWPTGADQLVYGVVAGVSLAAALF